MFTNDINTKIVTTNITLTAFIMAIYDQKSVSILAYIIMLTDDIKLS